LVEHQLPKLRVASSSLVVRFTSRDPAPAAGHDDLAPLVFLSGAEAADAGIAGIGGECFLMINPPAVDRPLEASACCPLQS
jgi:hypothetical protein